jgi:hypothetical protein
MEPAAVDIQQGDIAIVYVQHRQRAAVGGK